MKSWRELVEDDEERGPLTTKRVVFEAIGAVCCTIVGADAIWTLFIEGEETALVWLRLGFIPGAVWMWVRCIRCVDSDYQRLWLVLMVPMCVIGAVGWYRTEHWVLGLTGVFLIVYLVLVAIQLLWLHWRTEH